MTKSFNLLNVRKLVASVALVVIGGSALAVDLKLHLSGPRRVTAGDNVSVRDGHNHNRCGQIRQWHH